MLIGTVQFVRFASGFYSPSHLTIVQNAALRNNGGLTQQSNRHSQKNQNDGIGSSSAEENEAEQKPQLQRPQEASNVPPPVDVRRLMQIMGTSPRRIFLSTASSITIALVANFFGITSNILSQLPEEFSENSGLDYVYPRGGFKRVSVKSSTGGGGKCSFLIPKEWVADTGLALAQAQRQVKALDLSMNANSQRSVLPDAAFGPPGRLDSQGLSNGDTNVSVIVNTGVRNFSLKESLGSPSEAAEYLISKKFRRPTTLLTAFEDQQERAAIYQFEYIVDRGEKYSSLRAISVIAGSAGGDSYVTLTVVSPSPEWEKTAVDEKLRKIVNSFKLV